MKKIIDELNEKVKNDQHPFFIFLKRNEANFNKKELVKRINEYQKEKEFENDFKLDSRNIYIENENINFIDIINSIYNYFFECDSNFVKSNNNYTINILVSGSRGSGKSTLINRILGEKRAFSSNLSKTSKLNEYYHKNYPIKLIDSAGFQIGNDEYLPVDVFLKNNNLENKNMDKRIHFIFYTFKYESKMSDKEYEIIKSLYSFNVNIYFIISSITKNTKKRIEMGKNNFKDLLLECMKTKGNKKKELIEFIKLIKVKLNEDKKQNLENKEQINEENLIEEKEPILENYFRDIIDKNIFCIDLLDNNFYSEFDKLFSSVKSMVDENIKVCKIISESIESYEIQNEIERSSGITSDKKNKNSNNLNKIELINLNSENLNKMEEFPLIPKSNIKEESNILKTESIRDCSETTNKCSKFKNSNLAKEGILTKKPTMINPK